MLMHNHIVPLCGVTLCAANRAHNFCAPSFQSKTPDRADFSAFLALPTSLAKVVVYEKSEES